MATQDIKDLLASATALDLTDTYLVIDTIQDAYTRTYAGGHPYIVKAVGDEYQVYPVKANEAHTALVQEDYPIIFTDGDEVFYTARTTIDPYNFAYPQEEIAGADKERTVLKAFLSFAADEFQFGGSAPYQVFLVDGEAIVDGDTTVTP